MTVITAKLTVIKITEKIRVMAYFTFS